MLGLREPAENSPEVVQAQLAAFSHALVNTKGKVQTVDKSLAQLRQKLEQETQLRQQLEVRFEELECPWTARTVNYNAHTDELATVVGDIKAWRKGLEDELKLKHEQLANAQHELSAELQQRFDGLRASSGRSGTITQWDEISGISMDLDAITKRFEKLELHCKGLDKLVRHGLDSVKEPPSKGSGASTFVTDLAHRCDKMDESIVQLLAEVPELSERSLRHSVSIEQLVGQRLELMDEGAVGRAAAELSFASLGADMQEERIQHCGAMKAMEESMRSSEEQRGGDIMKANEDMVRLTALIMEMSQEVGTIKSTQHDGDMKAMEEIMRFSEEQRGGDMMKVKEEMVRLTALVTGMDKEVGAIKISQTSFAEQRSIQAQEVLKGLDDSRVLELRDFLSVVTERTSGLEEQSKGFRTDLADIFGILEALDSSQLNRIQGQLETFSKELQSEKKERESETELLRSNVQSIVQSLEEQVARAVTQAPRPGPRRGGESQRTSLGMSARQPDTVRDGFNLARVAPSAEQIAGFRADLRQRSPDVSRAANTIQVTRDISPPKMSAIVRRDPLHGGPAPIVPAQCSQPISPVQCSRGIPTPALSYRPSPSASIRILSRSPSPSAVNHRVLLSCTPCDVGHAQPPIDIDIAFGAVRL